MKGLPCVLTSAALALAAVSASAEVVMWYRFNDLEPGSVAGPGAKLVNAANPGTLDLTLYSYSGTTVGTDSSLMPVGTNSFGSALKVWDPLTGRYFENDRAMHFGARGAISGTAMAGSIAGSGTGTQPIFNQFTNVTVEAIFRLKEDMPTGYTAPIVQKNGPGGNYGPPWGLTVNDNGIWQRFRTSNTNGSYTTEENFSTGGTVSRGVWHHAAFTFDAQGNARLYLDYVLKSTRAKSGSQLEPAPNNSLVIGARSGISNSTFPGEIDEVRICDTALSPDQFLRILPETDGMGLDADTVFYQPFDATYPIHALDFNVVTNANRLNAFLEIDAADNPPAYSNDAPGEVMRQRVTMPDFANASSFFSETNAVGKGSSIRVLDPASSVVNGDFTMELFFKASRPIKNGRAWTLIHGPGKVLIGDGGTVAFRAFVNGSGSYQHQVTYDRNISGFSRVDDGLWHHYAWVYDHATSNNLFYIDYRLIGSSQVRIEAGDLAKKIHFGRWKDDNTQCPDGYIDSPRIVRRALRPPEFLTTHVAPNNPRTLAQIRFENDFSVEPYTYLQTNGKAEKAVTDGELPLISAAGKKAGFWMDGETKADFVENLGCVMMNGSRINFGRNSVFERQEFTLEFFARLTALPSGTHLVRMSRVLNQPLGSSTWAVFSDGQGKNHICVRAYVEEPNRVQKGYDLDISGANGPKFPLDGKWHHYAVTTEIYEKTNLLVKAYLDYQPVGDPVRAYGKFWYPAEGNCLSVGVDKKFVGRMDELRFSDGVLPVPAFMRAQRTGMFLLVR